MAKILGVDPGLLRTGVAVIEEKNKELVLISYNCIKNHSKTPLSERYLNIYNSLNQMITQTIPSAVAMEKIIYCNNTKVAISLGEARGLALLAAIQHNIPFYEYSPKRVKQAVVGNGNASKKQVQQMVARLLNRQDLLEEDISDAIAVAICHLHNLQHPFQDSPQVG